MSKAVKGVARGIGKVVKGVGNVVKKVASSKLGKIIVGAALVYFGGAALMGGMSTIGTSTSFLTGMQTGLSSAATGISNAWSALTSGNLTGAGEALSQGFTGSPVSGPGLSVPAQVPTAGVSEGLTNPAIGNLSGGGAGLKVAPQSMQAAVAEGLSNPAVGNLAGGGTGLVPPPGAMAVNTAGSQPGLLSRVMSGLGPYGTSAAITGGTQLAGSLMQGVGMQQQAKRQEQLAAEQRAKYNANIAGYRYG